MAGLNTLPMVWSRQRPGARSITNTLIGPDTLLDEGMP
jgi:hypothetical protein